MASEEDPIQDVLNAREKAVYDAAYGSAFALMIHHETTLRGQNVVDWLHSGEGPESRLYEADDHAAGVAHVAVQSFRIEPTGDKSNDEATD